MKDPAAQDALRYIKSKPVAAIDSWRAVLKQGEDQVAIRCWNTLIKITEGSEVEDIDILGLAYVMKQGECG